MLGPAILNLMLQLSNHHIDKDGKLTENMKNYSIFILLGIYAILSVLTIIYFNGTGDDGDSVFHYQFAKYAPLHPELFFDHWAKPVFVLLASPFAQFGFTGMKVFNVLVSLLTIYITYRIILEMKFKNAMVGALIIMCAPLYFVLMFSGLTEPLFALVISMGLYAVLKHKFIAGCIIISFLPFVRSEGLIIAGVFGLYLLMKGKWKFIPWLLTGHLVYSIAGYFVHHDLLWVFNKIPYARLSSTYGSGQLSHFAVQLFYVIGAPIYILCWIGLISIIIKSIQKRASLELQFLVGLGFLSFFVAHSLFWYLGIFNSMGLKRVLLGVIPLISIVALTGFNFITEELLISKKVLRMIIQGFLIVGIVLFPFPGNKAAIDWDKDLRLSKGQQSCIRVADYIFEHTGTYHRFILAHTYLSEVLNLDHFDQAKRLNLTKDNLQQVKPGDIIIWDNWFAVVDMGVNKEDLDNHPGMINVFNVKDVDGQREILYSIYVVNNRQ